MKIIPDEFYKYIRYQYEKMIFRNRGNLYEKEYFLKWRPFSRRKYCIVRAVCPDYSIFAAAKRYIFVAEYARHNGMYPIMDLEWREDFKKGVFSGGNVWETVFCQKRSPDFLKENATILVSGIPAGINWHLPETCIDINNDPTDSSIHSIEENWRNYYKKVHKYVRKYWKFNQHIIQETNQISIKLFEANQKILGVAMREEFSEEFYESIKNMDVRKRERLHPLGPNVSEVLDIVADYLEKWKCDKIFVASIYIDTIRKFEERFPGKVVYCERERSTISKHLEQINSRKKFVDDSADTIKENRDASLKSTVEYVQETILLSKCFYLIGAKSGQTAATLALNGGKYKDIHILYDKRNIERY